MEEKDIQRALQREYIPYYAMEEIKKRISDIEKDGYSYVDTTTENIVLRDYLVPNSLEPGYYTDKDFARLKDGEAIKVMKFSNGDKVRYCLVDEEDMVRHMPLSRLRARGDFLAENVRNNKIIANTERLAAAFADRGIHVDKAKLYLMDSFLEMSLEHGEKTAAYMIANDLADNFANYLEINAANRTSHNARGYEIPFDLEHELFETGKDRTYAALAKVTNYAEFHGERLWQDSGSQLPIT